MKTSPFPWARPAPVALEPGERILWHDTPAARAIAVRLYHVRLVAFYGGILILADMVQARLHRFDTLATLQAAVPSVITVLGALLIFALLALGSARTTRYTLTDRRVIMQFGLSLSATISMPLSCIAGLAVRVRSDGSGDIALRPERDATLSYLKIWPFVRTWSFFRPEPMLRGVHDAGSVATVLTRHLGRAHDTTPPRLPVPAPAPFPVAAE